MAAIAAVRIVSEGPRGKLITGTAPEAVAGNSCHLVYCDFMMLVTVTSTYVTYTK